MAQTTDYQCVLRAMPFVDDSVYSDAWDPAANKHLWEDEIYHMHVGANRSLRTPDPWGVGDHVMGRKPSYALQYTKHDLVSVASRRAFHYILFFNTLKA
jgi:hypothetical protein